jgi:hypothetical protein
MTSRNAILTPFVLSLPSLLFSGCAGGKTAGEHIATCHHGWVACPRAPHRAGARVNTMRGWQSALRKDRPTPIARPALGGSWVEKSQRFIDGLLVESPGLPIGVYGVRQADQTGRGLSNIITKPPKNDTGRRLRVGECPNLRPQIAILMFGFLQPFEIIWSRVLVVTSRRGHCRARSIEHGHCRIVSLCA